MYENQVAKRFCLKVCKFTPFSALFFTNNDEAYFADFRRSTNRNIGKSKPPLGPGSERHSFTSGMSNRRPSGGNSTSFGGPNRPESPISKRESTPDSDQKTLLDIDRDITRYKLYEQTFYFLYPLINTFFFNIN